MKILSWVFAILIPPIGVLLADGKKWNIIISIILTILAWLPGMVYAILFLLGIIEKK